MKFVGIYCLTSPSGKSYIGQTKALTKRLNSYKNLNCKNQTAIYSALRKYGSENFIFTILEECPIEELNDAEKFWISYFGSMTPRGYNIKIGGTEIRQKLSLETLLKFRNRQLGKPVSQQTRDRISKSNMGKKLSQESINKISKSHTGKKQTKEHNNSVAEAERKKNPNWGITKHILRFRVRFKQDGIFFKTNGFKTIEEARTVRDQMLEKQKALTVKSEGRYSVI